MTFESNTTYTSINRLGSFKGRNKRSPLSEDVLETPINTCFIAPINKTSSNASTPLNVVNFVTLSYKILNFNNLLNYLKVITPFAL